MRSKIFTTYLQIIFCFGFTQLIAVDQKSREYCAREEQPLNFQEKYAANFQQLCNSLKSIYALLSTDFFESQKLCDLSYLNTLKISLEAMPVEAQKCHTLYFEQNSDINAQFAAELLSSGDDQTIALKEAYDDQVRTWITESSNIQIAFVQKLVELVDFFIENQGHYQSENNQIEFDSIENAEKFVLLSNELDALKQKELDQLKFLPKS
jgi:hypothetical protein